MITCPYCGHGNDKHLCVGPLPAVPGDGDYSLCMGCGFWGIFEGGSIRKPDDLELAGIVRNPNCMRAMDAWVNVMKSRRATGALS